MQRRICRVAGLPKPAGVFAANDAVAESVIMACSHNRLDIPGDIAVLGVDDDKFICESADPTLSSIATDAMSARLKCLELLKRMISGKPLERRLCTIAPLGVVRRASTLRTARNDPAVVAACDLIRRRACDGLKARDVAATFPCGRRMAEIRFRAMIGHSILDEIRAVRMAKAKASTTPIRVQLRDTIAAECGYASWSSVYRLLKDR